MQKEDKKLKFEIHVNEVLKPKLQEILEQREKIFEEEANYLRLSETVTRLKGKKELKTKVDLGRDQKI